VAILDPWKKRYPNSEKRKVIENREALLAYDTDPKRTLEFLKRFFNLQFNHVQDRRIKNPICRANWIRRVLLEMPFGRWRSPMMTCRNAPTTNSRNS
jgi:hypothetical protein